MPNIKQNLEAASQFFNDLNISIGRAQVCLDKNIIEEPNLSILNDALNDIEAVVSSIFGREGTSLVASLADKKQLLDDGIA